MAWTAFFRKTAEQIFMIFGIRLKMGEYLGLYVLIFHLGLQGGPPRPLEVGKFEGSFQSQ